MTPDLPNISRLDSKEAETVVCSASSWWYYTCITTLWVLKLSGRPELTSHIPPMGRVTSPEPSNLWSFFFQLPIYRVQIFVCTPFFGKRWLRRFFFQGCWGCSERSFWTFSQSCTLACGPDPNGDHCLFVNACSYLGGDLKGGAVWKNPQKCGGKEEKLI